ncbi:MAG: crotonase/enoyl-CoA hydratase family protein [Comamonadaceae bacterium]|nr:crotonase/enoyl-CoA hydratase family protein [Comamonadaceae bacterium]
MEFVDISIEQGIATLSLNSPATRNAISAPEHYNAVEDACVRISRDKSVRVAVLTGRGSAFCAGGDIKKMHERASNPDAVAADERYRYKEGIHRVARAVFGLEIPVIAAINGSAIGAGLDLACMCDIRIAARNALFAESFVKLGIIPGDGGAWLLQQAIGPEKAARMIFTGDTIDSQRALEYGLISEVVDEGKALEAAQELALKIAGNPPHALRMAKRLLRESQHSRFDSILEMSAAYQALAHFTPEHRKLVAKAVARTA